MNKNAFSPIILLVLGGVIFLVIVFLIKIYNIPRQTAQNANTIQNVSDLDSSNKELDSSDLNQIDSNLNQLSTDSSGI